MFAALERGDLRRWPKGLFRRSFFQDYVRMIGVPVAEACAEFVRLFPDHEGAELSKTAGAATEANQAIRPMMFAWAWCSTRRGTGRPRLSSHGCWPH